MGYCLCKLQSHHTIMVFTVHLRLDVGYKHWTSPSMVLLSTVRLDYILQENNAQTVAQIAQIIIKVSNHRMFRFFFFNSLIHYISIHHTK